MLPWSKTRTQGACRKVCCVRGNNYLLIINNLLLLAICYRLAPKKWDHEECSLQDSVVCPLHSDHFQPVRGAMPSTLNCFLLYFQLSKHAASWSKLDLTPCPPRNSNKEMQWKWPVIQSRNDIIQGPINIFFFNPVSCCYFWLNLTISTTRNIYPDPTWLEL